MLIHLLQRFRFLFAIVREAPAEVKKEFGDEQGPFVKSAKWLLDGKLAPA
jgi:hypothetical protein